MTGLRAPYLPQLVFALAMAVYVGAVGAAQEAVVPPEIIGTIERADRRVEALLPADAKIEKLAAGFKWSEGPVWIRDGGFLLFSDVPQNSIFRWKDNEGLSLYLKPSGYTGTEPRGGEPGSNGLALDPQGRLVMCQHGDRRVVRVERDGSWTVLADRFEGKRFNSPNDLVFRSDGTLYFTDPPYGLQGAERERLGDLGFCGVYQVTPDGKVILLTKELSRPNGIALSPDEKTLYVANSDGQRPIWMAYPVLEDGSIGPGRVFFDATPWVREGKLRGAPDGLAVDIYGNLWATGPGGVNIFSPQGEFLGRISPGVATANCCFGGPDGSTLYITAHMFLCRVKTSTKGLGF